MGKEVKIGCCGFAKGRRDYFARFRLVEIQQTFYKPPQLKTALHWREEAPQDFEFTIKAWQLITHHSQSPTYRKAGLKIPPEKEDCYGFFRPTAEVSSAWQTTKEVATALKARVIVFQCPARFVENAENIQNLRNFFQNLERENFLFVWEPRGDWSEKVIRSLCEELDLIHCVDPFEGKPALHGQPRYFRLHGGPGYRHRYSDEELKWLAGLAEEGGYFLFNNLTMYDDALRFAEILGLR